MKTTHKVPFSSLGIIMAIGIVFGDIGTSPLYVMRAILAGLPEGQISNPEYILGAVSCIIWTLTLQTTLKYVIITLKADNNGEGGILSLYALIRKRYSKAYLIAALGAAALLADGIITPAMTVMSAIEGLHEALPSVPTIPVTLTIIILLFTLQPLGTGSLGKYFGFIMVLWFSMILFLGLYRLVDDLSVLKAFNPYYAINFLITVPQALIILGAIFLCTTGAEALYSDLGHCGLKNIRVAWIFVKSSLIINYLGQAAWIIHTPTTLSSTINPFFMMMPEAFHLTGILMATVAAIIASQALISGSFTIISEAVSLNIWPNIKIKYPTNIKGQMYIPSVNYVMLLLCISIILALQSSIKLESAYGLSITISMLMTSFLLFLYFQNLAKPIWISLPLTLFFVCVESLFLMACLQKFTNGGYIPIIMAIVVVAIMFSWHNGRRIKRLYTCYDRVDREYTDQILKVSQDTSIPKIATHLVYIIKANNMHFIESKITFSLFKMRPKRADTYWFVRIKRTDQPYEFSYQVTEYEPQKIFRINIKAGFKLGIHTDKYVTLITEELERQGRVDLTSRYPSIAESNYKQGDFIFIVVDRTFRNMALNSINRVVLACYDFVKRLTTSDTQVYDIDPSISLIESIPILEGEYTQNELKSLLKQSEKKCID